MLEQDRIIKINIEEEMKSSYMTTPCRSSFHVPFPMLEMDLSPFTAEFSTE